MMTIRRSYFPAFSTRQSEFRAFRELSPAILDRILPVVTLTRERNALSFREALDRMLQVVGSRPVIVDFDPLPRAETTEEAAVAKLKDENLRRAIAGEKLRQDSAKQSARYVRDRQATRDFNRALAWMQDPTDGFRNWTGFALAHPNLIPIVRLTSSDQVPFQISMIAAADRQMAFRVSPRHRGSLTTLVLALKLVDSPQRVIVILDAGHIRDRASAALEETSAALAYLQSEIGWFPSITTVCMSGSFPKSLAEYVIPDDAEAVAPVTIEERRLFESVRKAYPQVRYGDHASVQPSSDQAGGSGYYAHVEVVHPDTWHFSRATEKSKGAAYVECAGRLVEKEAVWNARCESWGTGMVARAALGSLDDGDGGSFKGPGPWVGPRVSQHITVQALRA